MASLPESNPSCEHGSHLDTMRETGALTDVILACGEKQVTFPAHKAILSKSSRYFEKMFSSAWEENQTGKVKLPTVEPEEMEVILLFLYTGRYTDIKEPSLLDKVLHTSHFLQIHPLADWCCNKLAEGLSPNNVLELYNLAELLCNDVLESRVISYLSQHITKLCELKNFLKVTEQQMKKIVRRLNPDMSSTDNIVKGLLCWAEVGEIGENRDETLLQIMTTLNLQHISSEYLTSILRQKVVQKNCNLLLSLDNEAMLRIFKSVRIKENVDEVKILVFGKNGDKYTVKTYDANRDHWSETKILPFVMERGMSACWFDGYVYVFGASDGNIMTHSRKIIKYCPSTNTTHSVRNLIDGVIDITIEVMNESIYVLDGTFGTQRPNIVQQFDPLSEKCVLIAQPNSGHRRPSIFVHNNSMFVITSAGSYGKFECYHPDLNEWTNESKMQKKFPYTCLAAFSGGKLFMVPEAERSEYYVYDFATCKWEDKESKGRQYEISNLKSVNVKGKEKLVALTLEGLLNFYDIESQQWTVIPDSGSDDSPDFRDRYESCYFVIPRVERGMVGNTRIL